MDLIVKLLGSHIKSWTIILGVAAGILTVLAQAFPAIQTVIHSFWPANDAWLVVASMWIGRVLGFVKQIQASTPQ